MQLIHWTFSKEIKYYEQNNFQKSINLTKNFFFNDIVFHESHHSLNMNLIINILQNNNT